MTKSVRPESSNKFDSRGEQGLFIGWHVDPGLEFHGDHLVVPLEPFLHDLDAQPNPIRTRDITIIDGPFVFPLREALIRFQAEKLVSLHHAEEDTLQLNLEPSVRTQLVDASTQTSGEHAIPIETPPAATP